MKAMDAMDARDRRSATSTADVCARQLHAGSRVLLAVVAFVTSCTALPPPSEWRRVPPAAPETQAPPAAGAHTDARRTTTRLDRLDWARALEIGRDQSPRLATARARIRRAEALLDASRALSYPRVDARASGVRFIDAADFRGRTGSSVSDNSTRTRLFTGRGSDIYSAGVDVSLPVFDGGGAYWEQRAAESALDASRADEDEAHAALELAILEVFLDALLTEGAIRIAEDSLEFAAGQEQRAQARSEVGEGLEVDKLRFATRASEQRYELNRARASRQLELTALGELLGVELPDSVEVVPPTSGLDIDAVEGDLIARGRAQRPELRALRARITEAEGQIAREKASYWPQLSVFGSYGVISLDSVKLSHDNDELQVGGAMALNVFEGGATAARIARWRSEADLLRELARDFELRVEREVRTASIELDLARKNVAVSVERVDLAARVLERVTATYDAGEAQVIDVTESELSSTTARLVLARSQVELLRAQLRLRRAAGLGLGVLPGASR